MSSSTWFDYTGADNYWKTIPLLTVKRAFLKKGGTIKSLAKLILNSVTYDFEKSAQGGAVIMANDYSTIEFISPDGRIPYDDYNAMTLGQTLDGMEEILKENPVPAWDKFAAWLGEKSANLGDLIFLHNGDGLVSHCGIVDKVEGDTVVTIEGNTVDPTGHFQGTQGGAVAERRRKLTDDAIVSYGRIGDFI